MVASAPAGLRLGHRLKVITGLVAGGTVLVCGAAGALGLWWERDHALSTAETRAANVARMLSAYVQQTLAATDAALRQLVVHSRRVGGPGAPASDWQPVLVSTRAALSGVGSLSVTDAEGVIRHSTIEAIVGQPRAEEYLFPRLKADGRDLMIASTPFQSLQDPTRLLVPVGRRLTDARGGFVGTVVATLVPESLQAAFERIDMGLAESIWVFHPTGLLLYRDGPGPNPIGQRPDAHPVFMAARNGTGKPGTVRSALEPGGRRFLSAYEFTAEPPLIVAVSVGEAEALGAWRREVEVAAWTLVGLVLLSAAAVAGMSRQIDARAKAEEALARARRLEAVGQLTGGIAHDFNNLLTIILGSVSLLQIDPRIRLSDDTVASLDSIEHASRRAADMTRALLSFARQQPLRPDVVDLNDHVHAVPTMLARLVGPDITISVTRSATPVRVRLDAAQFETALVNLAVNARDAMPQGGRLSIETASVLVEASEPLAVPTLDPGPYCLVTLSDTGTGIPPGDLDRIHEPFFTTKAPGKGMGLGLSMVHAFMRQSGGHLRIESEVGRGTLVKLYFPTVSEEATAAVEREKAVEPGGHGEGVLLVEPEESVRFVTAAALRGLGYRVFAAGDGASALEMARREPPVDLLLTDVVLPQGMTGPELAEQIAGPRPSLRVLYSSGYSSETVEQRAGVPAGSPLLSKPYDRRELARAVRAALDAHKPAA